MNCLLIFLIISPDAYINTSIYTFHKLGAYSISDFHLNYGFSRYHLRTTLEKRSDIFGLKSFGLEIDSIFKDYRLILGEKVYYFNSPLSTTLNLWGLTFTQNNMDLLLGKTKDPTSLPPTFKTNDYTFGFKIRKNTSYRIPLEFYFFKKSDRQKFAGGVLNNNSFGTNTEIKLARDLLLSSQVWGCYSDIGFGSVFAIKSRYTKQKYGGYVYFRRIFNNYVTPANLLTQSGNWLGLVFYQKIFSWVGLSQDITYSSFNNLNIGNNITLTNAPWPEFGYCIHFSKESELINQTIHSGWRFHKFNITGNYNWSKSQDEYNIMLSQTIKHLQIWSGIQLRGNRILRFGMMLPFNTNVRLRNFLNITEQNVYTYYSTGTELSLYLLKDFNLRCVYEFIHHNSINDNFISFSISNRISLDRIGFGFIFGKVFMDTNHNGIYDIEDQTVSNTEIILDDKRVTRTDNNGYYKFPFVTSGKHNIRLNLGCLPAEIGSEKRQYIVDTKFLSKIKVDFPLGKLGVIEGYVFYDDNKNAKMDKNEEGVPNVVLGLNGFLTTTDAKGKYRFANLSAGTYVLEVKISPPGTIPTLSKLTYIYIKPGQKFSDFEIGIIRKERSVKKKVFDDF